MNLERRGGAHDTIHLPWCDTHSCLKRSDWFYKAFRNGFGRVTLKQVYNNIVNVWKNVRITLLICAQVNKSETEQMLVDESNVQVQCCRTGGAVNKDLLVSSTSRATFFIRQTRSARLRNRVIHTAVNVCMEMVQNIEKTKQQLWFSMNSLTLWLHCSVCCQWTEMTMHSL